MTLLPQTALAEIAPEEVQFDYTLEETSDNNEKEVTRLGEITGKRERNKKYFLNSDNTITAEIHTTSVHYPANNSWEEIDNTFN